MTDLFTSDQAPTPRFEDLVGPDKKYKTPEDAAKAIFEKDNFIESLKREAEEARTELRARTNLEELAESLKANREITPPRQEPSSNQQEAPAPTDITAEVQRLLKEEKARDARNGNIENTRAELKNRFGGDYNATLLQIAQDLGVSDKFLTDMAATSPNAFLKLVDSVRAPDNNRPSAPPASQVNTHGTFGQQVVKNKAYFDNIRKTDLNNYFSKKVQNELHKSAMELGSKFFE